MVNGGISMIMEKLGIRHLDWKGYENDDYETIRWTADAKCTKDQWETAKAELQAEYDANQYQRDRQYPTWQEQMDMQYHDELNGTTTWKDAVAKVKADNPKPE